MKKCSALLLLLMAACSTTVHAAQPPAKLFLLTGTMQKDHAVEMVLMKTHEGKRIPVATTKTDKNNGFAFALTNPEEGFYYVGESGNHYPTRIYIKNEDALSIEMDEEGYKVVSGSKENKLLADWAAASGVIAKPATAFSKHEVNHQEYFKDLNAFLPEAKKFREKVATPNQKFNALMKMAIDLDVEYNAMHYLLVPHSEHAKRAEYPEYYSTIIKKAKFPSASVLQLGEAADYLMIYGVFCRQMGDTSSANNNPTQWTANLFGNDTVKGVYVASRLTGFRSYDDFVKTTDPVKKYLVTDSMQAAYFAALKAVSNFKKGNVGYNFNYEDVNGKKVSLADLKGKVVLVDVWATWCGPCKKELPFLKTLEEEMKGKNVSFVSISVDDTKDKDKWKDFVKTQELGGTQLFAAGWSDLVKYYDIKGIPRFMVFDKEGKIVTIDSPRPSEPELKALLEETIKN
jgi:thiol-disulfide isomerase/thioredoxin